VAISMSLIHFGKSKLNLISLNADFFAPYAI